MILASLGKPFAYCMQFRQCFDRSDFIDIDLHLYPYLRGCYRQILIIGKILQKQKFICIFGFKPFT
jgi:hypothetical protein